MAETRDIKVPDIGDLDEVEVIEVLVEPGREVELEDPLITLESDKASMDVPSPLAGKIVSVEVKLGDKVGEGHVIARIEVSEAAGRQETFAEQQPADEAPADEAPADGAKRPAEEPKPSREASAGGRDEDSRPGSHRAEGRAQPQKPQTPQKPRTSQTAQAPERPKEHSYDFDLLVLGSGPGGYTAAFRAADLGLRVCLVERYPSLGGVCLNVGCIPSKALLHAAKVIDEARAAEEIGLRFAAPEIELDRLRGWKDGVVERLTSGLGGMAKRRQVEVVTGHGELVGSHEIRVSQAAEEDAAEGAERTITFAQAILAAGSHSIELPFLPNDDPRVFDSTGALALAEVPQRLLVVGGGIIGLEMATVYAALGARVSVVELLDGLMTGADRDLVKPLRKELEPRLENLWLATRLTEAKAQKNGIKVSLEGEGAPNGALFDALLVAVGRRPNGRRIGAAAAGVEVEESGFIATDEQMRTNVPHIFAIGDLTHGPMLAHKATHEGKVAAEVAAGLKSGFEARVIPSVAYTDPEVAWVGLTETEAKERGVEYEKGTFPWSASGRALGMARAEGLTKLLFDPETERVIGGGVVGPGAGDLIAEIGLAIEMGADAQDIGLTVHPHPTLSETVAFAAEAFEGTITDLYLPKQKRSRRNRV
ncbi:MAG: dihydrolipoyl dehydrogenase [Acidobacteria bacterium]|nr:MAG: dihydrolipoyl dehydrogenase [Acidobacteriota bacterium]REK00130.1 MAG: dihydrolipoyl dehydrogenase [Acidobacteriota bacterium]